MSIVAERPVRVQGGTRQVGAGLAEEVVCQEAVDNELGPEPEGRLDDPLTAAQASRLGELYEQYGDRVLRAIRARLLRSGSSWAEALTLGDDIAAGMWADLARRGGTAEPLLVSGPGALDQDTTRIRLLSNAKWAVSAHWKLKRSHERPADFTEPQWRDLEAGPLLTEAEVSERCAELLSMLPQRMREVMAEHCYGVPIKRIAERLGMSVSTAGRVMTQAQAVLRGEDPQEVTTRARKDRYRAEAERARPLTLEDLEPMERVLVRALTPRRQDIVLLRLVGVSQAAISIRLKIGKSTLVRELREIADLVAALEQSRAAGTVVG